MKHSDHHESCKSLKDLKRFLENRSLALPPRPEKKRRRPESTRRSGLNSQPEKETPSTPRNESLLFEEAMAGVTPLSGRNRVDTRTPGPVRGAFRAKDMDAEVLSRLDQLIRYGKGFVVADTSEYMEGLGHNVHPEIAKRLHRGDFSIQAHVDLHGLTAAAAREVFERFLKEAVTTGKRAVLIVHGRGLRSPVKPVLKTRVREWLTSGPWRKWVLAFTSARSCDGGAGATYVLLRRRPLTKRFMKKNVNG
ncbi:MAG: DNA mismatch repair protein MutS [Desulfobacterales bacterium]|nr:DNA mismatch repair protein MutS [Desulfobacterales bacterium]